MGYIFGGEPQPAYADYKQRQGQNEHQTTYIKYTI